MHSYVVHEVCALLFSYITTRYVSVKLLECVTPIKARSPGKIIELLLKIEHPAHLTYSKNYGFLLQGFLIDCDTFTWVRYILSQYDT